jgi:hypothetical protein
MWPSWLVVALAPTTLSEVAWTFISFPKISTNRLGCDWSHSMKQAWYVASIILKCEVAGEPTIPTEWTCLQQIHVLRASDREVAYGKAIELGKSLEHPYLNAEEQDVTWTFVGLENLEELSEKVIRDGTEIWGRIFSTQSPDDLVVEKEGLSVFYIDEIRHLTAREIIEDGIETRLVCNRVKY